MVTIAAARRPLGVILEEREDGRGVEVLDIDPSGNAAGEDVLVGDRVLMVDAAQCADEGFDAVAGRIGSSAGDRVELTLGRRVGTVRIIWPNGVQSGALPGEPLQELATKARYPVKYACTSGSCGTCEHRLRTPSDDDSLHARLCVARVPKGKEVAQILPGDRTWCSHALCVNKLAAIVQREAQGHRAPPPPGGGQEHVHHARDV